MVQPGMVKLAMDQLDMDPLVMVQLAMGPWEAMAQQAMVA